MKKIFALVAFVMTALCSTPALAMDARKRPADAMEQGSPLTHSPKIPAAPCTQRVKIAEGGDWNARAPRALFNSDESSEEEDFGYDRLALMGETPEAPTADNNDEFDEAFAAMNKAPYQNKP